MYARIGEFQLMPDKLDQFSTAVEDITGPLKDVAGFDRAYALVSRETNRGITIAVFDTRDHAEAFVQTAARNRFMDALSDAVEGTPTVTVYELTAEVRASG